MNPSVCNICDRVFKNNNSLGSHKRSFHKIFRNSVSKTTVFESPIEHPIDLHIQAPESAIDNTLNLHFHQDTEDPLDQYLKDRNNRYDAKDFDNYVKEIKTKDTKSIKAEPYNKPEESEEAGSSSGNVEVMSICHICDEEFSSEIARSEHMDRRHPICNMCNDRFNTVDKLKRHFKIFHPPNVHALKCPTCEADFSDINTLIKHTDEHPQCEICRERFLDVPSLGKHRKVHDKLPLSKKRKFGDFEVMCGLCNRMFKNAKEFERHAKRKHDHTCDECELSFPLRAELKNHKKDHSSGLTLYNPSESDGDVSLVLKPTSTMKLDDRAQVDSQGTDITLSELASQPESNVSKDTVLASQSDAQLKLSSQDTDSQDSEMTILVIESDTDTQDSTSVTSYQKDTLDYVESDNSIESIDTVIDNSKKPDKVMDRDSDISFDAISEQDSESTLALVPINRKTSIVPMADSSSSSDSGVTEMEVDMKPSQLLKCQICFQKFTRKSFLLKHLKKHDDMRKKITVNQPIEDSQTNAKIEEVTSDSDISDDQKHSQVVKCRFCGDKFFRKSLLYDHIKEKHKKNKHRQARNNHGDEKCPFCDETPSHLKLHIRQEHSFSCKGCRIRFKSKSLLLEHISLEHPTCKVCSKTFNTKRELLTHQKDHPEEPFDIEETTDEEDSDESEEDQRDINDREFHENINCVTIERFAEIRELITKNDFKTLSKNKKLLKGLSIIMNGVKRGFIPICSAQRLVLTNSQRELLYRLAKSTTGHLVMKERQDLSLLFDILWDSVRQVSAAFLKYDH